MTKNIRSSKKPEDVEKQLRHGSVKSYIIGFVLSVALTLAAYFAVTNLWFDGWLMMYFLIELAVVQFFVQIFLFLHLGEEKKPRWNLVVFAFMMVVLGILVAGSLWIMDNLDYHMQMTPEQTDQHIMDEERIYR